MFRQSIRPEWWHTFPGGLAHFASASETPGGDGGLAAAHRFRDVLPENHPGRGRKGRGEGGNGLPHRAGNASAAAREPSHLLARCEGGGRNCNPGVKSSRALSE